MDDRLQRRLRDADPLAAADGQTPSAARLDAIKEQVMRNEERPPRAAVRRRTLGLVGVAAASLALVLVAGSLARPGGAALAWAPEPTTVTAEQRAAAEKACTERVVVGSGTIEGLDGAGEGVLPSLPPLPTLMPPLTSLELHGNGGVAILSDETTVGYCLLKWDGTRFTVGGLALGPADAPAGSFAVTGAATEFDGQALGIVGGVAPSGAVTVTVVGGPADGGTATVQEGRFAMWLPGTMGQHDVELVARDAAGREVGRQALSRAGAEPVIVTVSPNPDDLDGSVEGMLTPAP